MIFSPADIYKSKLYKMTFKNILYIPKKNLESSNDKHTLKTNAKGTSSFV